MEHEVRNDRGAPPLRIPPTIAAILVATGFIFFGQPYLGFAVPVAAIVPGIATLLSWAQTPTD